MLRSIKQLYGNKLGASDGELGHVKDFYFDDQNWAIRYLVADPGTWLPKRQVLLSPYSLGRLEQKDKLLRVNLTRRQIENSPGIDWHQPVSRQYEEEYSRNLGWPFYWQGGALWGTNALPVLESPALIPTLPAARNVPAAEPDRHLRSTQAVTGYQVRTPDGEAIGHVCDFMMDAGNWVIGQLVIKTGHRLSGVEELIPTKRVNRISYEESTIFVLAEPDAAPNPVSVAPSVPVP